MELFFDSLDRRTLLKSAVGACGLSLLPSFPAFAQDAPKTQAKSAGGKNSVKSIIVLWMAGGPSQLDTFDPKPGTEVGGPFKAIDTTIPGVKFSEHLPQLAKMAKELSVIRSMSTKEGNHRRASYMMRTGYAPQGPVQHPSLGALMSKYRGKQKFDLPNFVSVNSASVDAGFLGVQHSPFVVNDPQKPVENLSQPGSVNSRRFKERWKLLQGAEKRFAQGRRPDMVEGHRAVYEKAERFMHSKIASAFDLSKESPKVLDAYGRNKFGAGCLMAKRLVKVGVPFVEVTLGGWDTHRDNFNKVKELSGVLDPAFSQLIRDLKKEGLFESTLVLWTGDFGRTPRMRTGGRGHFPQAWTSIMTGAGVGRGVLLGDTGADGTRAKGRKVSAADLFSTVAHLTGINPSVENISKAGRPIRVVDKEGTLVNEVL